MWVKGFRSANRPRRSRCLEPWSQRCASVPPSSLAMTRKTSGSFPAPNSRTMFSCRTLRARTHPRESGNIDGPSQNTRHCKEKSQCRLCTSSRGRGTERDDTPREGLWFRRLSWSSTVFRSSATEVECFASMATASTSRCKSGCADVEQRCWQHFERAGRPLTGQLIEEKMASSGGNTGPIPN